MAAASIFETVPSWPGKSEDLQRKVEAWADAWRSTRDREALNRLHDYFVANLPMHVVTLQAIVDLLGPPDNWDSHMVYYGNRDSGLVLLADARGLLDGMKLN